MFDYWAGRCGRWIVGISMLTSLTGCASEKYMVKEPNKDFFQLYREHVAAKYQKDTATTSGKSRLKDYDALTGNAGERIQKARQADDVSLARLIKEKEDFRAELKALRLGAVPLAAVTKERKKQLDKLDAKRKLLVDPAKDEIKIAQLDELLDAANIDLEKRINDDNLRQEDIAGLEAKIASREEDIALIRRRDYIAFADQDRQAVRNEIIHEILLNADTHYLDMRSGLLMGRASSDTLLDIAELTLSTATTLSGGAMAKANLGAASTLVKGSRTSVDKNFFAQQALAAIINSIDDRRQIDKTNIIKGLQRTAFDYPLQQALSDARLYESRASMMSGVLDLSNQTANNVKSSEIDLEKEKTKLIGTLPK